MRVPCGECTGSGLDGGDRWRGRCSFIEASLHCVEAQPLLSVATTAAQHHQPYDGTQVGHDDGGPSRVRLER